MVRFRKLVLKLFSEVTGQARPPENDDPSAPLLSSAQYGIRQRTGTSTSLTIDPNTLTYSYSYGSKGLAGLRRNSYALICAFLASIGGLSFGYDQWVVSVESLATRQLLTLCQIANVLVMPDFVRRWPITPLRIGAMSTSCRQCSSFPI
jgi:hypothetical protein